MSLKERIQQLEQQVAQTERVARQAGQLLAQLRKPDSPPTDLERVHGFLRSASDLLQHEEKETAEHLVRQAEDALGAVRQWLGVSDLSISPFVLRNFLEKNPADRETQMALVHYFLHKQPHAETDRDKLDYLLTTCFGPTGDNLPPEELPRALEPLFADLPPRELSASSEVMLHEVQSLVARIDDFTEFDQLVHARMVERARTIKINFGEDFYHPRTLPGLLRFNVAFRRRFEKLLAEELKSIRQAAREQIEEAWKLTRAIEAACERLSLPENERAGFEVSEEEELATEGEPSAERLLQDVEERLPLERLVRRGEDPQKENELRGLLNRVARFVERLPAEQARAEKVAFPLRDAQLELSPWEQEAFRPAAAKAAPESARAVQTALAVIAWILEEVVRYQRTRDDRYLWKPHFDLLSYAVVRSVDLLKTIHGLVREDIPAEEAAWFGPLLQISLRLATTLNKLIPVFAEPESG